jgi:hypothetical protein
MFIYYTAAGWRHLFIIMGWTFKVLRWVLHLNRLVDLGEILCEDNDIEDDLDSILTNPVASTIPIW